MAAKCPYCRLAPGVQRKLDPAHGAFRCPKCGGVVGPARWYLIDYPDGGGFQ